MADTSDLKSDGVAPHESSSLSSGISIKDLNVEAFAIRKKNTNLFLPGGRRRGFTNDEPTDWKKKFPRLFNKKRSAKDALRWWLKGICIVHYFGDGDEDWTTQKVESRNLEDMEIVKLKLEVVHEQGEI